MKQLIIKIGTAAILVSSALLFIQASAPETENTNQVDETCYDCRFDQCHATAKSTGKRCKHCVSNQGDLYCWQHK